MFKFIRKHIKTILFFTVFLFILVILFPITKKEYFNSNNGCIYPIHIKDYNIYDIYYNDNGCIVLIREFINNSPPPIYYYDEKRNTYISFDLKTDNGKYVHIYTLTTEYKDFIKIKINNEEIDTKINKYPEFEKDNIIFSTIVKDEDDYIIQWMEFHKRMGVSRFIIYDNSEKNTLELLLKPRIEIYEVCLIKWPYKYWSGRPSPIGQIAQMNHSLYAFQNCRLNGFFDIDEYVNIQVSKTLPEIFDNLIAEKNINTKNVSGFKLLSKFFHNPDRLNTEGYKFLYITTCGDIIKDSRSKNFVIPKNVSAISDPHLIIDGPKEYIVDETIVYFNHYSFLNKPDDYLPGLDTYLKDDSILRHISI